MAELPFKYHYYYRRIARRKHYRVKIEWVIQALEERTHRQVQNDGRIRYWSYIEEANKWLRLVLLEDDETVYNAFFDKGFNP
jgi:hypothetical protein